MGGFNILSFGFKDTNDVILRDEMNKTVKDQLGRVLTNGTDENFVPVVILVRPQLGENIGAAARAMLNFGLDKMRLVAPRDGWPNPDAAAMAAGALPVLEGIEVFETVEQAVADLHYVLAATARRRELELPVTGTHNIGETLRQKLSLGQGCGILFGPEKAGLTNDDVIWADEILTYPINPAFQSLNLAQAICIFSYIWKSSETTAPPPVFEADDPTPPATRENMGFLFAHLEDELSKSGFFYPKDKTPLMIRNIRSPFMRAKLTEQEVRTFRGIIKSLVKGRGRHLSSKQGNDP